MKTKKIKIKDKIINNKEKTINFFEKIQLYVMGSISVVFFSLISLAILQGNPTNNLMASISNVNKKENINFESDVLLQKEGNIYKLIAGSEIKNIDYLEGIILYNPEYNMSLNSKNYPDSITKLDEGIYRFSMNMNQKTIKKGTIIDEFSSITDHKQNIVLTDTQFVSNGIRYNLSNSVQ